MAPPHNSDGSRKPIAIIGASYSGLVLSNVLHENNVPHVVLEAATPPSSSSYVVGGFYLPAYPTILSRLGIQDSSKNGEFSEKSQDAVSRSKVIRVLLQNVKQFIQYNTRIHNIIEKEYLFCESEFVGLMGPFQFVICSNGARSPFRMCNSHRVLLMGDARWVSDRFWDFGLERIKCGGNTALLDGLELGTVLSKIYRGEIELVPRKFCSTRSYRDTWLRRLAFWVVILSVVLGQIHAKRFPFSLLNNAI